MKKFESLGRTLGKAEQKKIKGGDYGGGYGGGGSSSCNVYCGTGSGGSCTDTCLRCEDAGNGKGSGVGQDKMCFR